MNTKTYPIVKWAGGKRQLMSELLSNMPTSYNRYFEPFIGGGALFFELKPDNAYISDMNEELINLYSVVRDNVHELIKDLRTHRNSKDYYLIVRNIDRTRQYQYLSDVKRASRFIYLNKTCFNGLYRVNSKGQFNVPFGRYGKPRILDEGNLLNCSELLKKTEIRFADFSDILTRVKKDDFVYLDPPYVPLSKTSKFISYTKCGFDMDMQLKLRNVCNELHSLGVKFMLSNSDKEIVHELYANYDIKTVQANRTINSKGDSRGKITELLIKNY